MAAFGCATRIVLVGGGKMGEAMLGGWMSSEEGPASLLAAENFTVADPGPARRDHLARSYGVACVEQACGAEAADIVVLAVKPQVMMDVLAGMADCATYQGGAAGPLFVSIAAGLSTSRLEGALPSGARLVRVMPNMPLLVGAGAAAVCPGAAVTSDDVELVRSLFACLGEAVVVGECDMDAVCALSGSGPAYVAAMIEALRDAAASLGLDPRLAEALAVQTVYGTAAFVGQTHQAPEAVREAVCSPGGTTLAGLAAMEAAGFSSALADGVAAAARRSKELGAC